ncbi:MAG: hypothetical protein WBQ25_26310, partial [Nitrososphaeraceae archaeon]
DYVSWRSIESRTGISKSDVYKFILKELLDNAVDFIESGSHSKCDNDFNLFFCSMVSMSLEG